MNRNRKRLAAVFAGLIIICVLYFAFIKGRADRTAEYTGFAMDTVLSVRLYGGKDTEAALSEVNRIVLETEKTISRHLDGSLISRLNAGEDVMPDEVFRSLLEKNLEMSRDTGGLFDMTAGPLISLWGIGSGNERVPEDTEIQEALSLVSPDRVHLSDDGVSLEPGTMLDLGASGKGYLLDRIRTYLSGTGIRGAVISAGGSVLVYGTHDGKETYTVAVREPDGDGTDYLGVLTLSGCCVSTSGDYERYFTENGVRYHHILSALDGYPADTGLRSVTAIAEDGTLSDLLSTAVFLLGKDRGLALLEKYGAEGVLVSGDRTVTLTPGLKDCFTLKAEGYTLEYDEGIH